ncbi:hypothetical protein AKJ60_00210 [candidate division MSBL1 archaeon SCGC-AAA385M11]|nr:hypothetical protein AKJ60_00210 [candidate division MSBL1 archaeon SCGC-AAA385M11]
MKRDPFTEKVIGCALEVHRALGPGLLESTYQQCLAYELSLKARRWHPAFQALISLCSTLLISVVKKAVKENTRRFKGKNSDRIYGMNMIF